MRSLLPILLLAGLLLTVDNAIAGEACMYTRDGQPVMVSSRDAIPSDYISTAKCFSSPEPSEEPKEEKKQEWKWNFSRESKEKKPVSKPVSREIPSKVISYGGMALPDEIELEGNVRVETIRSNIGTIQLRWPRKVEQLFGRTPNRATIEAARTVSRVVRTAAFPTELQNINLPWKVIFLDEKLPETQIPANLISNCHPGWMTAPANIYIVGQRIAAGCGNDRPLSASVADSRLAEVLIHEMGHALEFYLLKQSAMPDRIRAEGFATWFETYAADYSSMLNKRELEHRTFSLARKAIADSPDHFVFQGTAYDYARASMYFTAIVDRYGMRRLIDVYQVMENERGAFLPTVERELGWDLDRFSKEIERLLRH